MAEKDTNVTTTLEDTIADPILSAPAIPESTETAPPVESTPRTPTLADLMSAAENEVEDTAAKAQAELAAIIGRADQPFHGDGRRFLQLVDELQIPRTVARAVVEAAIGWNRQRDRTQVAVAALESRQAELTREITELEAKQAALAIDPSHELLLNFARGFVATLHSHRTPAIVGAFLRTQGWSGRDRSWDRGNDHNLSPEAAWQKTLFGLLQSDLGKDRLRELCATNVRCGGIDLSFETSRITEKNL
jgi:hypothetical protein